MTEADDNVGCEAPIRTPNELEYKILKVMTDSIFGKSMVQSAHVSLFFAGHVALAQDLKTSAHVAIKISSLERMVQNVMVKTTLEDPLREARMLRIVSRPGGHKGARFVNRLLDEFVFDKCHWMVLDLSDKGDLLDVVKKGRVREADARRIFHQILGGLSFIHASGVGHLDLKPENILLDSKGDIKICDFGMSRIVVGADTKQQHSSVSPKAIQGRFGTIWYMCPEAYAHLKYDPFLADVYSAGVILFMLLSGSQAYYTPVLEDQRFALIWHHGKPGLTHLLTACKVEPGRHISKESVDLLSHILCPEQTRWNIEKILAHEWMMLPPSPLVTNIVAKMSAPNSQIESKSTNVDVNMITKSPSSPSTMPTICATKPSNNGTAAVVEKSISTQCSCAVC